jgi:hypothetical protein
MLTERQQRVLAVLSTSLGGMALRDLRKGLGEGLPEWELKKWTDPFGRIPILQKPLANLAAYLYWLKLKHPGEYRRIVSAIRLAAPYFDDFVPEPLRHNERTIRLVWKHPIEQVILADHDGKGSVFRRRPVRINNLEGQ